MNSASLKEGRYGAVSMVQTLRRVLVCPPGEANARARAAEWNYSGSVDLSLARTQHDALVTLLAQSGVEIAQLDRASVGDLADAIYTHDPSLVTASGAVLLRMGKSLRRGEERVHEQAYGALGIPILGRVEPPGTVEGGDCVWLDERTLFMGRGFRTNASGIEQIGSILKPLGVEVAAFDLPCAGGARDCLHLMSIISLLDADLALGVLPHIPVRLVEELARRGVTIVEAPFAEYQASRSISGNVLAVGPRDVVMVDGFPQTVAALETAGCRVRTFAGSEICTKMEGGPTCLTRPLLRGAAR